MSAEITTLRDLNRNLHGDRLDELARERRRLGVIDQRLAHLLSNSPRPEMRRQIIAEKERVVAEMQAIKAEARTLNRDIATRSKEARISDDLIEYVVRLRRRDGSPNLYYMNVYQRWGKGYLEPLVELEDPLPLADAYEELSESFLDIKDGRDA